MKKYLMILLGVMLAVGTSQMALAGEHGGQEHGGKTHAQEHGGQEHGGVLVAKAVQAPSNEDIRTAMQAYVTAQSEASGTFDIEDPDTGETLHLSLEKVHERVGKTGDYYYSCADFKDVNTEKAYDLDLDVADNAGALSVVDVRVHKVEGEPRYTYDDNDNRIPLVEGTKSHLASSGSLESEAKEHGGNEHGGKEHGGNEHGGKEHGGNEHGGKEHGGN